MQTPIYRCFKEMYVVVVARASASRHAVSFHTIPQRMEIHCSVSWHRCAESASKREQYITEKYRSSAPQRQADRSRRQKSDLRIPEADLFWSRKVDHMQ